MWILILQNYMISTNHEKKNPHNNTTMDHAQIVSADTSMYSHPYNKYTHTYFPIYYYFGLYMEVIW